MLPSVSVASPEKKEKTLEAKKRKGKQTAGESYKYYSSIRTCSMRMLVHNHFNKNERISGSRTKKKENENSTAWDA